MNIINHNNKTSSGNGIWARVTQQLDRLLNWLYGYRGTYESLPNIDIFIWAVPSSNISFPWISSAQKKNLQPAEYFLHYFQSQGYGPTKNECVTTSVIMGMNIAKDRIASSQGLSSDIIPDRVLENYTRELDSLGIRGWFYRFSTASWLPGMMTPWQAVLALKDFAILVKSRYGKEFKVKLSARHNLNDLIEYLKCGRIILIHGAWRMTLFPNSDNYNPLLSWLGGMPHTMVLVGYDGPSDQWILLNPAKPWLTDRSIPASTALDRMSTRELLDFWGRRFLFYPPRFSVTVIAVET